VYDAEFHAYPVRETIHIGNGSPSLVFEARYDQGLGTVGRSIDFNSHETTYGYDALGRLTRVVRPATPKIIRPRIRVRPRPDISRPPGAGVINYVETRQRDQSDVRNPKSGMYFHSRQFSDGLGRL
jgi:YD repeat-containing protein